MVYFTSPFRRYARANRRAFTLVELLVVIGIIALLISILLPSLNRAREEAKAIKCASNLRTLGHAVTLYVAQNKGFLAWWSNRSNVIDSQGRYINPYMEYVDPNDGSVEFDTYWAVPYCIAGNIPKEILSCPSETYRNRTGTGDGQYDHYGLNSFGKSLQNITLAEVGLPSAETALHRRSSFKFSDNTTLMWVGKQTSKIRNSSDIIFAQDSYEVTIDGNGDTFWDFTQFANPDMSHEYLRHNKRANCLFLDGHVERFDRAYLEDYRWYTGRRDLPLKPKP